MRKIQYYAEHPRMVLDAVLRRCGRWIKDDKLYLSLRWWCRMGYCLDWEHPQTFCEKLQWLKLYDRKAEYTKMVDKYAVKEYVAEEIGWEYIIPTLGVWDKPEDIDWDMLPNQFVLKTTHGGGGNGVIICKDKSKFDKNAAICKLRVSLKNNIYVNLREWPYKDVPKRIIAERYVEDESGELRDYKVMCFGGDPKLIQVHIGRNRKSHTQDLYDTEWNKLEDLNQAGCEISDTLTPKPICLEEMLLLSQKLSKNLPQLRVDWYIINGKLFFGENTFYDASGLCEFIPKEKELEIGSWIQLMKNKEKK